MAVHRFLRKLFAWYCFISSVDAALQLNVPGTWTAGSTTAGSSACENIDLSSSSSSSSSSESGPSGVFFDAAGLECGTCGAGGVASADGLSCECQPGHILVSKSTADSLGESVDVGLYAYCLACNSLGTNLKASEDQTTCIACDSGTGATFNSLTFDCDCPADHVLLEFDAAGVRRKDGAGCYKCPKITDGHPQDTHPDPSGSQLCVECPVVEGTADVHMIWDSVKEICLCPDASALPEGIECEDTETAASELEGEFNVNLNQYAEVVFREVDPSQSTVQLSSGLFEEMLVPAAAECNRLGTRTACNALANLCVLQQYDVDSAACGLYEKLVKDRDLIEYHEDEMSPTVGWAKSLPWLYYDGTPSTYYERDDIELQVSFAEQDYGKSKVSDLVFVLSTYALNGTWLGFSNWNLEFQACGGRTKDLDNWKRFGTNYKSSCSLSLEDLMKQASVYATDDGPLFFDIYLQDLAGASPTEWPQRLYPVPIFNRNLRSDGVAVNANDADSDDLLVRRFFVMDTNSGATAGGDLKAIRVLTHVTIDIEIRSGDKDKIYPPRVTLDYVDRNPSYAYTDEEECSFNVEYSSSHSAFWELYDALMIVVLVFAGVYWFVRMTAYQRRLQNHGADGEFLITALSEGAGAFGAAFFVLAIVMSWYWFLFFKLQSQVFTMLPEDNQMGEYRTAITIAAVGCSVHLAHLILVQCNFDLFFLDWEKPRVVLGASGRKEAAPVSVWRQLFIANEFNELQTRRITSPEFTIFGTMFFLLGLDLEGLSIIRPGTDDLTEYAFDETSLVLRFAMGMTFMIGIPFVQYLYKVTFYHRYVEHPLQQFVDLLSVSNVSMIILDQKLAGFYLHGRAVAPSADNNLIGLTRELKKEEEMQVSARGLLPGGDRPDLAENQSFEIYLAADVRQRYESKLLRRIEEQAQRVREQRGFFGPGGPANSPQEQTVQAAAEVAAMFRELIGDVESNPTERVREKLFYEKLFDMPPEMGIGQRGTMFFHDFDFGFGRVLFYGIELELILFEASVFGALNMEFHNAALAGAVTYIFSRFVRYCRASWGETNISNKALVDDRFLF